MLDMIFGEFRELNLWSITLRFGLAILCGGVIGIERGKKKQAAGFRTHILVCMGAMIAMMTGQFVTQYLHESSDPTRLGAQVISGIGFLGVGTIIVTQSNKVKGLTTAAGLWTAACIGISIGIGFYEAAIVGTAMVLLTVVVLQKIDERFYTKTPMGEFFLELESVNNIKELVLHVKENNLRITSLEMQKSKLGENRYVGLMLTVKKINKKEDINILEVVSSTNGLIFIEEVF